MWRFVGRYKKRGRWIKFTKIIDAPKRERAEEILYSEIGSKHRVKRASIVIEAVEEVKE
ncbi:TPA: 50S ribosomal protein L18a [Candidatus Micrarchaeota archaeon]|nr:50S ribosomal protein L18a [Candidatus Micrarchaeota archaeon]